MVYGLPAQAVETEEVGVTIYCTVPLLVVDGFVSTCEITEPDPALAPVIPPVIVPTVQLKLLAAVALSVIFVLPLLQIKADEGLVTAGVGFTVTVMVYGDPTQEPAVEVGITVYSTVPAVVLLGFDRVCAMVDPFPALAPLMLPVIAPMVQLKLLAVVAVRLILVVLPLQISAVFAVVTTGVGFTVTVIV